MPSVNNSGKASVDLARRYPRRRADLGLDSELGHMLRWLGSGAEVQGCRREARTGSCLGLGCDEWWRKQGWRLSEAPGSRASKTVIHL